LLQTAKGEEVDFSDEAWQRMRPELQKMFKRYNQEFLGIE